MLTLKAKKRDIKENLDTLRKGGELPAVFYGAGSANTPISILKNEFKKVWREAGESSTVKISTGETGKPVDVLIQEVQVDPVTSEPLHVDFLVIDMNKKVTVDINLEFVGISEAVKSNLGTLVKVLHKVEIEALPKDLPNKLTVDISKLKTLEDVILVSDIKLPVGVEMKEEMDEVVASIAEQKEEVEEVAPVDLADIEVEKKGKKEEEGAEGEVKIEASPEEKK